MRDAYVGRIDVAIDVEKAGIAVTLLADGIRKPANGEKVRRAIERDAVLEAQALACENLVRNRLQPLVGDSKFAHCASSTDFSLCSPVNKKNQPTQAEQVAEICVSAPSGVKTPEENADFMSCLKARPTKLKTFSATCEACATCARRLLPRPRTAGTRD